MLEQLLSFVHKKALFKKEDKVLLAVSGGLDSMVMANLLHKARFSIGIAHCNFQLRGKASDGDEAFVANFAKTHDLPFHSIRFDTLAAAKHYGSSIQLTARDLRYQWLEDIRSNNGYRYIATAHHLNDSLETLLYNLSKGCGIRGLHGIPVKSGNIIRPLSFASRSQLSDYANNIENISYREDESNASTKYNRNWIRLEVIPKLEHINPALLSTFSRTLEQIREAEHLFLESIQAYKGKIWERRGNYTYIHIPLIAEHPSRLSILYELLSPIGFHIDQISQLLSKDSKTGAIMKSPSHELLKNRKEWVVRLKVAWRENFKLVKENLRKVSLFNQVLSFHHQEIATTTLSKASHIALLDIDALQFPLTLRAWQAGDRFQPFGMKGKHKKVQDFLSDLKLNRFEKEEVLVLESDGRIAWVVGYRIGEAFKIRATTQKVLKVEVKAIVSKD